MELWAPIVRSRYLWEIFGAYPEQLSKDKNESGDPQAVLALTAMSWGRNPAKRTFNHSESGRGNPLPRRSHDPAGVSHLSVRQPFPVPGVSGGLPGR